MARAQRCFFDTIICESDFSVYHSIYKNQFAVIEARDAHLHEKINQANGVLFLKDSAYLDIFNFQKRGLANSALIFAFVGTCPDIKKNYLYPGPSKLESADFFHDSGCWFLNADDCKKVGADFKVENPKSIAVNFTVVKEAFNYKIFSPDQYVPALLLDRDGVLNIDTGYTFEIEKFELVNGVVDFLKKTLDDFSLRLILTNQAGVAKGLYQEAQVHQFNNYLKSILAKENIKIDGVEYCPFHVEGNIASYQKFSFARKPGTGMLLRHMFNFPINLSESLMVGDRASDILEDSLLSFALLSSRYIAVDGNVCTFKDFQEIYNSKYLS